MTKCIMIIQINSNRNIKINMNEENIANNRNRALYWQIYTKRKSVPNRNNPFAATWWPVLGCPLNVTAREPNRPHGQMNFPFTLPENSNKEIQIRQVDYSKPDLVRSRCQSKTIQTKDLSDNLYIGRGDVQLICN